MPKENVAALFALLGVLLSVVVAFLTSRRGIRLEIAKIRAQVTTVYTERLLDVRLKCYPAVYSLVSTAAKQLSSPSSSGIHDSLASLLKELEAWECSYGLFLGENSVSTVFRLRRSLAALVSSSETAGDAKVVSPVTAERLRYDIGELQLQLRSDLGVYGIDFAESEAAIRTREQQYW